MSAPLPPSSQPPPEDNVVIPLPPDVVVMVDRNNNNHGDSGPNFKDQARDVSFVVAAAAVVNSAEPRVTAGDEAQQEREQQHLGGSLSSLTATAASIRALTSTVIPLAQATPITVSQIHEEERVQLEQRNAELQAALGERQQQQAAPAAAPAAPATPATLAATDSIGGIFAVVVSLATAYWSKLSRKQRRRRWFCSITCVFLIITIPVLVDQGKKQRWKRRWQRAWQKSSTARQPSVLPHKETILDFLIDSENHTIWRALIEAGAPGGNSLVDLFDYFSIHYQFVFVPTDAAVEHHQVLVQQLLTAEWRQHRRCFVLSHLGTTQDFAPATANEYNSILTEELNGTFTYVEEWQTMWPESTMTIHHVDSTVVYTTYPYYTDSSSVGSSWVNGIPFFMADVVYTTVTGSNIYVLHERPITPPCLSQSLWELVTSIADLSAFVAWVEAAGLTELFNSTNVPNTDFPYTIFAPTNTAFAFLPPSSSSTNNRSSSLDVLLRNSSDVTVIKTLLLGHVVAGNWYANDSNWYWNDEDWWAAQERGNGTVASTRRTIGAGGHNLTVMDDDIIGMIIDDADNDLDTDGVVQPTPPAVIATMTKANVLASNGVLHLIDAVLWPPQ
jgi:uncharacterized surface protein with fasciclin (FAS1) repeats